MSFESVIEKDLPLKEFGQSRYVLNSKNRTHMSKHHVMEQSNGREIRKDGSLVLGYNGPPDQRYAYAIDITNDILITLYEVNNRKSICYRYSRIAAGFGMIIKKDFDLIKSKRPTIEARIIGMQNNDNPLALKEIIESFKKNGIVLVEVDLFGNERRHIVFDAKLGTTYNMLLEDRIYRPGELMIQNAQKEPVQPQIATELADKTQAKEEDNSVILNSAGPILDKEDKKPKIKLNIIKDLKKTIAFQKKQDDKLPMKA